MAAVKCEALGLGKGSHDQSHVRSHDQIVSPDHGGSGQQTNEKAQFANLGPTHRAGVGHLDFLIGLLAKSARPTEICEWNRWPSGDRGLVLGGDIHWAHRVL